jgi:gas vesicle protein
MSESTQEHRDYRFVIGLLTGAFVGAGLTMWLTPRSGAELRQRVTDRARDLGRRASGAYQQAGTGVGEAVGELTRKGRGVRDGVAEAVARGAHEVERHATTVKSDRAAGAATPGD